MSETGNTQDLAALDLYSVAAQCALHTWTLRTTGILRGLTHAFGNRLHALQLLRCEDASGAGVAGETVEFFGEELDECERLADEYRALVLALGGEMSIPCLLPDVIAEAVALRAAHADVMDPHCTVTLDAAAPPVLAEPRALLQAVLLLVLERDPGSAAAPDVSLHGDAERVEVLVRRGHPTVAGGTFAADDAAADAVRWMLRHVTPPVRVEQAASGSAPWIRLTLPSLAVSRRAERMATL